MTRPSAVCMLIGLEDHKDPICCIDLGEIGGAVVDPVRPSITAPAHAVLMNALSQASHSWSMRLGPVMSPAHLPVPGSQASAEIVLVLQTGPSFWCFLYHIISAQTLRQAGNRDMRNVDKEVEKLRFISFFMRHEGLEKESSGLIKL